jgi:predicted metal-dependent phosphoesterase TrpH
MRWKRADLHAHTSFSGWRKLRLIDPQDCYVAPDELYRVALARGMDYVCFTDHDTIDGALDVLGRHPEAEPRVIVGEEVETYFPDDGSWIHLNVYGVDEEMHRDLTRLRPNCFELVAELRRRDALFALNHPFQSFRTVRAARRHLAEILPLVPAVETSNSTSPRSHRGILEAWLGATAGAPGVFLGGSDAHTVSRIASVRTAAPGDTKEAFLDAVRRGECAIEGREQGALRLVADVYSVIGAYYRTLYGPRYPLGTARRLKNIVFSGPLVPVVLSGFPAVATIVQSIRQELVGRAFRTGHSAVSAFSAPDRSWSDAALGEDLGPSLDLDVRS